MASVGTRRLGRLIGHRIRELRHERGWGQVDLEAHVDGYLSQGSISHIETGQRLPSLRALWRLAQAFEVEPAALLLSPDGEIRHQLAVAILDCPDDMLTPSAKLLDIS